MIEGNAAMAPAAAPAVLMNPRRVTVISKLLASLLVGNFKRITIKSTIRTKRVQQLSKS
jgi:hypothetical protein